MTDRAVLAVRAKVVLAAVGVLAAGLGGAFALGVLGAPAVVDVENRFGGVDDRETVVLTDLVVHNPNPVGVRLGDTTVDYTVRLNDVDVAAGAKEGLDVPPGNSTLNFTTRMKNERIPPWWVSHLRNGERTNVTVDATVRAGLLGNRTFDLQQDSQVETDILGAFNSTEPRPVDAPRTAPLVSNPVLYVNETSASWGTVTRSETPMDTRFVLYNPKLQPYVLTELGYTVEMNGVRVGEGASDRTLVVPPGGTEELRATTVIRNARLDEWWVSHLRRNQVTDLEIDFYATVELPTGDEVRIPLDRLTYETTIETDLFGTKTEAGASGDAGSDGSTGDASDSGNGGDAGGAGATPTGTATPTPTDGLVGTPTTDDGGLLG